MKYASIDIETTGLDEEFCQVLSVGIVIEDTNNILPFKDLPKFHAIIIRDRIQGEPFALNMNKNIIGLINSYKNCKNSQDVLKLKEDNNVIFTGELGLATYILRFFEENDLKGKITVAGKNYTGFDKKFLDKIPGWRILNLHRRVIDPATLFVDWSVDNELPDLNTCKKRAGIKGAVTHDAIDDAWDVIQVLRTKY